MYRSPCKTYLLFPILQGDASVQSMIEAKVLKQWVGAGGVIMVSAPTSEVGTEEGTAVSATIKKASNVASIWLFFDSRFGSPLHVFQIWFVSDLFLGFPIHVCDSSLIVCMQHHLGGRGTSNILEYISKTPATKPRRCKCWYYNTKGRNIGLDEWKALGDRLARIKYDFVHDDSINVQPVVVPPPPPPLAISVDNEKPTPASLPDAHCFVFDYFVGRPLRTQLLFKG